MVSHAKMREEISHVCVRRFYPNLVRFASLALGLVILEEDVAFTARDRGLVLMLVSSAVVGTLLINASTSAQMLRMLGLLKLGKSQGLTLASERCHRERTKPEHLACKN